jgi:hypothetical protein
LEEFFAAQIQLLQ